MSETVPKSVRVNLTIPGPVHELLKRGAEVSGLSVSGFIASWLVSQIPNLRSYMRGVHGLRDGQMSFYGDPLPASRSGALTESHGLPATAAERADEIDRQEAVNRAARRQVERQQAEVNASASVSRAERRRQEREQARLDRQMGGGR